MATINDAFGPTTATKPSDAIELRPGDDYQAIVKAAPEGATFWFDSGIHRLTKSIEPKDDQTFLGAPGAVLDGSHVLTNFSRDGSLFVAGQQTQRGVRNATGDAAPGAERAGYPETLFEDGRPLQPVDTLSQVAPGKFYFDYKNHTITFADDPTGHVMEAGVAPAAFASNATGVTIGNLTIQNFDSPAQQGAIQGGEDWTIEHDEIRSNYGVGATARSGSTFRYNDVHDNGEMGLGGTGDDITVENNEIHSNGYWSGIDQLWEGGGQKFSETNNLVVRDNYSHDNHGFGMWTDGSAVNTLYEGNLIVDNDGGGINHEISYSAKIDDNTLIGNGSSPQGEGWVWGGQIQLQNSSDVEISNNRIDMGDGLNGIDLIQQDRGSGPYGEHTTTGNYIHDNTLVDRGPGGISGGAADYNEGGMLDGGNVFADNTYAMDGGNHWWWGDFRDGDTWSAYRADTNQDAGSTITSVIPDTTKWLFG